MIPQHLQNRVRRWSAILLGPTLALNLVLVLTGKGGGPFLVGLGLTAIKAFQLFRAAQRPPVPPTNNTVRQELERLAYQSTTPIVGIILEGYRKIAWQRNLINLVGYAFAGLVVISIELEAKLPNPAEAILILVTFALYILAAWKSTHKRVTRGLFRRTLMVGSLVAIPVVVLTSNLLGVNITTVTQPVLIDAVSRGLAWWAVMLAITFIVVDQA